MTKLMAFDLDGTILFNRAVESATEQAIARWQAEGNLAVSCTGKSIFATQLALNPTAIRFDYHVLYTGAVITDREYRVIYHQPLPVSVVQACYKHFSTVDGVALFATTLDNDYSLSDRVGSSTNILPAFTPLPADDLQNHEYVGVPLWIPDAQVREAAYTWILERFGDSVDCHKNQDFLDIVPPACSIWWSTCSRSIRVAPMRCIRLVTRGTISTCTATLTVRRLSATPPMRLRLPPPIVWIRRTSLLRLPCRSSGGGVQARTSAEPATRFRTLAASRAYSPPTPPFHVKHPLSHYSL